MTHSSIIRHPRFTECALQLILAYEWGSAGWHKLASDTFVSTLAPTLTHFAQGNPHTWYAGTVLPLAQTHASLFGHLITWGELLIGIGLMANLILKSMHPSQFNPFAKTIYLVALLSAAFMNLNFFLAAGWTSPSAAGLNCVMFWIEFVLAVKFVYADEKILYRLRSRGCGG